MSGASMIPILTAPVAATTVAIAAAARKRRMEEEEMTAYNRGDLDGWEFKIVRSSFGKFRSHAAIEQVCRQEAPAGWELLEKFDDCRLRFKRRVERRSGDQQLAADPYRTSTGAGSSVVLWIAVGLALFAVGLIYFAVVIFD